MANSNPLDVRPESISVDLSSSEKLIAPRGPEKSKSSINPPSNNWLKTETSNLLKATPEDLDGNDGQYVIPPNDATAPEVAQPVDEPNRPKNIHGKPVLYREVKTVLNMTSDFLHKLLCTGPVLNLGDACVFSCVYCYVAAIARKFIYKTLGTNAHQDVVVRRRNALEVLKGQLAKCKEKDVFHVICSSSLVDIAATMELLKETAAACIMILEETVWDIRLLTKSSFLPQLVKLIPEKYKHRLILGVSTGTFDDEIGKVIEKGTALISKRIESLHWLQDNGYRTFAMVCPSLPQDDYDAFAEQAKELLRYDRCEHVWTEVINMRGESFNQTIAALDAAGLIEERNKLALVCGDADGARDRWETYARATFEAHAKVVGAEKLRCLQYVERKENVEYWTAQRGRGAVLLGRYCHKAAMEPVAIVAAIPVVDGTKEIRQLLETNRKIEAKLKRKALTLLASWVPNVIKIGEFFSKQKSELAHGQYLNWLTTNFKIDRKTAGNYVAVYTQRERVLEAIKCGTVPHLKAAYDLARKANRLLKASEVGNDHPADTDTTIALHAHTESEVLHEEPEGSNKNPGETGEVTPVFDIVEDGEPLLVLAASEEMIAKMLEVAKGHDGKVQFQILRADGQIKLNEYFSNRLTGMAA